MRENIKYWIGFSLIKGVGPAKISLLKKHFGDLERAWFASASELQSCGLDSSTVKKIISQRPLISPEREIEKLEKEGVRALSWDDPEYPSRLREIYDPPPVLYTRGELLPQDEMAITVVGTRKCTSYGKEVTRKIVRELVENGFTIVSGLARGIDTIAHKIALEAGGRTLAVLACGLDIIYPGENLQLARGITKSGALLSEYPLGTKPKPEHFPRRNRIMSGISLGVLVVEAKERSGALITAEFALEQNREVFAIPGSIFAPSSRGTNQLIKEGAKLVQTVEDILEELNPCIIPQQPSIQPSLPFLPEDQREQKILSLLSEGPLHIDELCRRSGIPAGEMASLLTMLEIKGVIREMGNKIYILC